MFFEMGPAPCSFGLGTIHVHGPQDGKKLGFGSVSSYLRLNLCNNALIAFTEA